jgi:hypothetical protein
MTTMQAAKERFVQAQAKAMDEGNDVQELIAIGMQELADALDAELKEIKTQLQGLARKLPSR